MKQAKILFIICTFLGMVSCRDQKTNNNEQQAAGTTTSTFKVWGNCEMCQETIENSLKVDGVSKANWNKDTKIITVCYDEKTISLDRIQKNIAAAGYDNEKYKGDDKAYNELPECCQYERKKDVEIDVRNKK